MNNNNLKEKSISFYYKGLLYTFKILILNLKIDPALKRKVNMHALGCAACFKSYFSTWAL